ncbi:MULTISPECIES: thiamine pyrophosphate-dependent dehydrogenase E1 component subunit alpha [Micromonospora]|uniref:thiamine pyrophosphate-dependent dehydrogenase E1 component subunit alpha n=1 Tax=Micromonospora TaxID=1873 RepID=UPI00140B4F01|nr:MULTISPECIES: thiamine pyrophosphate-dependent enzyme [Micromonospora]MBC8991361.1 pyruvate dehydrogenase (acetyl-transferring) E1 component subunit alpha [Micromonospora chalcea]MBQ1061716.1 pyruvate dehydrogenase (acetyl-transferring) E1 component subunit alpha [Micromonospora sp. C41]NHO83238.1 pyruvate dehydrogenase (acetyl-transferring) E1 component subunit alpha [Micromonospora sp. CMU55-4]WBB85774.1 thiamine pyrophosphate-dependent enzyme [Micromonospora sp. WMMC264]
MTTVDLADPPVTNPFTGTTDLPRAAEGWTQLVTPDGRLHPDVDVDRDALGRLTRDLYRGMRLARRLDDEAFALQRQGELGLWLQCRGQEAAQVGSVAAVRADDYVFPSYREHAAALWRGIGPADLLRQWRGVAHSGWDPEPYSFHIYTLVLAAQLLHATGYALGVQRDGSDTVVVTYFGDGAASEGDASEAMNIAAVNAAPMVFFCQNNQWAISTPTASQTRTPIHRRGAGFGLRSEWVDGNDVLAVYAVTSAVTEHARAGSGPAIVEATTYRMGGHSTSDDPTRYRTDDELEAWRARDPLARVEALMRAEGWSDETFLGQIQAEADELADRTRRECLALTAPDLADAFATVLSDVPQLLREERDAFVAYRGSFLD